MALNVGNPSNVDNSKNMSGAWSILGGANGLMNSPISRGVNAENITRMRDALVRYLSEINDDMRCNIITIEDETLAYKVIVVTLAEKAELKVVSYHTLIIDDMDKKPDPLVIIENGQTIQHSRVVSDAYDMDMIAVILKRLNKEFPGATMLRAGATVVRKDMQVFTAVTNNENALSDKFKEFIYYVINFCNTELIMHKPQYQDISIPNLVKAANNGNSNGVLTMVLNARQERSNIETRSALQARSDIDITFKTKTVNTGNSLSLNNGQRSDEVGKINGFVDLINNGTMNTTFAAYNQNQMQQHYTARLVITHLESKVALTPASLLLVLSMSSILSYGSNWLSMFKSKVVGRNEIDFSDIGALGIEINLTPNIPDSSFKHIDTKSESVTPGALMALITGLIRPGLVVSMDVVDSDCDSGHLEIFAEAARADSNRGARDLIYQSAEQLTGGIFGRYFSMNDRMFVEPDNRVHIGYYVRGDEKRDIREIDYLAVANYASATKDPGILLRWAQTFNDMSVNIYTRLNERAAILSAMTNGSFVLQGYADRLTFSGMFINALIAAVSEAGLLVELEGSINNNNNTGGVSPATFVNEAISNPNSSFFRQNAATQNARYANVGYAPYVGRRF